MRLSGIIFQSELPKSDTCTKFAKKKEEKKEREWSHNGCAATASICWFVYVSHHKPFSWHRDISLLYDAFSPTLSEPMSGIYTIFSLSHPFCFSSLPWRNLFFHYLLLWQRFHFMIVSTLKHIWADLTSRLEIDLMILLDYFFVLPIWKNCISIKSIWWYLGVKTFTLHLKNLTYRWDGYTGQFWSEPITISWY